MPLSEKRKASNARWDAKNLVRMSLCVRVELHAGMMARIAETGETMNGYINRLIREDIEKEKP